MIKFIYFGRVTYEKGVDSIIETFSVLQEKGYNNWHLDIYGDGPLIGLCKAWAKKHPHNITVHGRASQHTIQQALRGMHYNLMPSRVMESFGMSALEAITAGVPVIGPKKGGLEQFVLDQHNTLENTLINIICNLVEHFSPEIHRKDMKIVHERASNFTREKWREKIHHMADFSRVFLVSDYIARIGGIESVMYNIKHLLENHGSQVHMYGWKITKGKNASLRRKLGLISTAYNLKQRTSISIGQYEHNPTLIRLHSVNRHLGRLPITTIAKKNSLQIWCTIHDMGMFHPFGASVADISDIPEFSLAGFISMTKNPFKQLLIILKYLNIVLVKKQLIKKVDTRLVPSPFLVEVLHKKRHIPLHKITLLPHFL